MCRCVVVSSVDVGCGVVLTLGVVSGQTCDISRPEDRGILEQVLVLLCEIQRKKPQLQIQFVPRMRFLVFHFEVYARACVAWSVRWCEQHGKELARCVGLQSEEACRERMLGECYLRP